MWRKKINEKINKIILNNKNINNYSNKIESQIDNIIKDYSVENLDIQLININNILKIINEDINNNNETIFNLINNTKTAINIPMNISNNNEIPNKKIVGVNNEKDPGNLKYINLSKK